MRVALISDLHFGARGDSLIFHDYFNLFYQNIFFPTLKAEGIKEVWIPGDMFDRRKFINFNILYRVRMDFLHVLENEGIVVKILPGNHDVTFKNTNEVNAIQELLGGWDNIQIFNDPTEYEIDGRKVLFIPWISSDNRAKCLEAIDKTNAEILIGHFEIMGFQMNLGSICEVGFERTHFQKFEMVLSGHFHHKSSYGNIHYLGSPAEMTFSDMNDPKGFHILDTSDFSLQFIQNPYRMFHHVTYNDRAKTLDATLKTLHPVSKFKNTIVKVVVTSKDNPYYFDKFLDLLNSAGPTEVKTMEDFTLEYTQGDVQNVEDTLSIISKEIDHMDTFDVDKEKMKEMVKVVYVEAVNMEYE